MVLVLCTEYNESLWQATSVLCTRGDAWVDQLTSTPTVIVLQSCFESIWTRVGFGSGGAEIWVERPELCSVTAALRSVVASEPRWAPGQISRSVAEAEFITAEVRPEYRR